MGKEAHRHTHIHCSHIVLAVMCVAVVWGVVRSVSLLKINKSKDFLKTTVT